MAGQIIVEEKRHAGLIAKKVQGSLLDLQDFLKIYKQMGIKPVKGRPVNLLEVGCGRGIHSVNFAQMGFTVTGIDLSRSAIKQAKARAVADQVKINFIVRDATRTGLAGASFDLIVAIDFLHHFYYSSLQRPLDEIKRLLKKNGTLILFEPNNLHPYTFLSFCLPHFLQQNHFLSKIKYFGQVVTVNERALNPFNLLKSLQPDFQLVALKFVPYTNFLASRSPLGWPMLKCLRQAADRVGAVFPPPYRHDHFLMRLKKIG
ncbi:hypothetical protein COU97_01175 [Candidatus Shapirobacteria bacterium CG10_big_fil_rev_8_21_14_0_10_48_15]|uniref:Methyltransferase type 11 domain-containing protein n=1 Tax=Candidatus Shapirobacteria bacterium CG10_big_fil_rev_8_21_14_0_10_48_15 TaxID=1974484 RepID=A0A2M8L7H8_9BACT|nr:MAG: hypothetical protein COU97_01175 [Candidatus Shapirobacteria bacterium CG10_big_fil_rev_8_21_14_0_10_48_15]